MGKKKFGYLARRKQMIESMLRFSRRYTHLMEEYAARLSGKKLWIDGEREMFNETFSILETKIRDLRMSLDDRPNPPRPHPNPPPNAPRPRPNERYLDALYRDSRKDK